MIPQNQHSWEEFLSDYHKKFQPDKPEFLSILKQHINLDELIPNSFKQHFYSHTGRPRKYHLTSMLWALIIQRFFSIPTDSLLILFLKYSEKLRSFCGFEKVPDAAKFTHFRQDFLLDLQVVFNNLVDVTEPLCQQLDSNLASMTLFDTSGIEAYVTENNPKFANSIIKKLKYVKKANQLDDSFDPYKVDYNSMPSHASSNDKIKQQCINGHFCYAYKIGIITNGLGIVRHIDFYNEDFLIKHPEIIVNKKSDSPNEDKTVHDARLLIPTLKDFFYYSSFYSS